MNPIRQNILAEDMNFPPVEGGTTVVLYGHEIDQSIEKVSGLFGKHEWCYSLDKGGCWFTVRPIENRLEVVIERLFPRKDSARGAQFVDYVLRVTSVAAHAIQAVHIAINVATYRGSWPFYFKCAFRNDSKNLILRCWLNRAMLGKIFEQENPTSPRIEQQEKLQAEYDAAHAEILNLTSSEEEGEDLVKILEKAQVLEREAKQIQQLRLTHLKKGLLPYKDVPESNFLPLQNSGGECSFTYPERAFKKWEALYQQKGFPKEGSALCRIIGQELIEGYLKYIEEPVERLIGADSFCIHLT